MSWFNIQGEDKEIMKGKHHALLTIVLASALGFLLWKPFVLEVWPRTVGWLYFKGALIGILAESLSDTLPTIGKKEHFERVGISSYQVVITLVVLFAVFQISFVQMALNDVSGLRWAFALVSIGGGAALSLLVNVLWDVFMKAKAKFKRAGPAAPAPARS